MSIDKLMRLADRYCAAWPYCDTPATSERTPAQQVRADLSSAIEAYGRACAAAERERCAKVCAEIEAELWRRYRHGSTTDRANPHLEGQSDGACKCAAAIRELKDE